MPLSSDVDVHELAKQVRMAWVSTYLPLTTKTSQRIVVENVNVACQTVKIGANGADIGSICREAAMHSLRDAKDLSEHEEFHLVRHCHVCIA